MEDRLTRARTIGNETIMEVGDPSQGPACWAEKEFALPDWKPRGGTSSEAWPMTPKFPLGNKISRNSCLPAVSLQVPCVLPCHHSLINGHGQVVSGKGPRWPLSKSLNTAQGNFTEWWKPPQRVYTVWVHLKKILLNWQGWKWTAGQLWASVREGELYLWK